MSVVNVAFESERILCLTDTLVYRDGVPGGLCKTKCDITPTFAIATRGLARAGEAVKSGAFGCASIDEAAEGIPQLLKAILLYADGDPDYTTEATLMGWSPAVGDLIAYRWVIKPGESDEVQFTALPRGLHLAPTFLKESIPVPPTIDDARMVKVALAQHQVVNQMKLNMVLGGVMHITEVTKDHVDQQIADLYPDYWEHSNRFPCPNAAEVAAYLTPRKACA